MKIVSLISLLFVVACATQKSSNPSSGTIYGPTLPKPYSAGDIVAQIYPNGIIEKQPLPKLDQKLSYLKIAAGKNYHIFTMFRGSKEDLVLEQITSCQTECIQKFKAHFFTEGKLARTTRFEVLYPKKKVDNNQLSFKSLMPNTKFTNDFVDWFRLPKKGSTIDVLVLTKAPGSTLIRKSVIYHTGELEWDGAKFKFKELDGSKPVAIKLSEIE